MEKPGERPLLTFVEVQPAGFQGHAQGGSGCGCLKGVSCGEDLHRGVRGHLRVEFAPKSQELVTVNPKLCEGWKEDTVVSRHFLSLGFLITGVAHMNKHLYGRSANQFLFFY